MLQSVTKGKSHRRNLETVVDPAHVDLAHWLYQEMKNKKKHAKCMISWLFSIMKAKESAGLGLDAEPNSDLW